MHPERPLLVRPTACPGVELLHARYTRHTFSRHSHDGYALGVIEHGALRFRYQHQHLVADTGAVNLVVPGECHDGQSAGSQGWAYRMFYFEPELVGRVGAELLGATTLPDFAAGVLHDPVLAATIRRTHAHLLTPATDSLEQDTLLTQLLGLWIARHAEGHVRRPGASAPDAVRRVRELLADSLEQPPRLDELARRTGLSPFHLLRVFTRATGQTPHEFLTQRRVEQVRAQLRGSASLADIAAACGFADQSHMTRHFRRQVGVTPGQYRKIVLNRPGESL